MQKSTIKTLAPLWSALAGASASLALFALTSDAHGEHGEHGEHAAPAPYARVSQVVHAPARSQLFTADVATPRASARAQRHPHSHRAAQLAAEAAGESGAPFAADMDFTHDLLASDDAKHTAVLRINSRPWARLYVDGRLIGTTPQLALRVSPGEHSIRLVNEAFAMSRTFRVELAAGESVTRVETLEE